MRKNCPTQGRRGALTPLAAVLAVVLIGAVAFAVDMSWIVLVSMQLQNAADASALAASDKLTDNYVLYNLPNQTEAQKEYLLAQGMYDAAVVAKSFASKNGAGGVNALTLLDQDIEFGFMNEKYEYTPMPEYQGYPNTVKVQIRRDEAANTPLNLFFAPALAAAEPRPAGGPLLASTSSASGASVSLNRSAAASLNGGFITTFKPATQNLAVLPMTLDEDIWDAYLTKGVDQYGNPTRKDALGNPTLEIYDLYKDRGNFGQLSLDGDHTGTSRTVSWIRYGMEASDVQALKDLQLLPVTADNLAWSWVGNPGFKSSSLMEVNLNWSVLEVNRYSSVYEDKRYVGKTFLLPLFKAKDESATNYQAGVGQGSNYYYNIVRFVGVRIMPTDQPNREIVVQPAAVTDPGAYFQGTPTPVVPPTATTPVVTTFTPPTLTR